MGKSRMRVLAVCPRDKAVMSHPGSSFRALVSSEAELSFSATFQGLTFLAPQRNAMDEREKRQKQEGKSEDNWEKMRATWVLTNRRGSCGGWAGKKQFTRGKREKERNQTTATHRAKHRMLALEVLTLHAWRYDRVVWSGQAASIPCTSPGPSVEWAWEHVWSKRLLIQSQLHRLITTLLDQ